MCYFLTTYLRSDSKLNSVREIADHFQIDWEPIDNASIREQIDRSITQYVTTKGICQCYLAPTGQWDRTLDKELDLEKDIKKHHQKGWSNNKIQRWVKEKEKTRESKLDSMKTSGLDGNNWLIFIREVIGTGSAYSIGMLFHFYSGDLDAESINLKVQTTHKIDKIDGWFLQNLKVDHFYWFTA